MSPYEGSAYINYNGDKQFFINLTANQYITKWKHRRYSEIQIELQEKFFHTKMINEYVLLTM